ncbi:MCP four helix bundle domain-containing protein [Spirosoma montaniterrae]|uniref:Chemotaxis methyl-accepting receptor HlyB-like 4HB MCP domain-containing protein n=1 Tax=Spirosoma montaniterrae TaxID=1178516 RepID=A0A1P9WZ70_9BACT|nr:MCP four helix bundle domain-containing protein [Spirosoma montaniterrae]AQG80680.1 hypothetical protein AWR27_15900 [Spirosoma montaniterrae]
MNQPTQPRSRLRATLLLIGILGLILTSIFLSRSSVGQIEKSVASIYKDRLAPTAILVHLTSNLYGKRLVLENYLLSAERPDPTLLQGQMDRSDRHTDSLLTEFEQTRLTQREAEELRAFRQYITEYNQLEKQVLQQATTNRTQAQKMLFTGSGNTAFGQAATKLDELSALQLTVGEELLSESRSNVDHIYVFSALQIGLTLLIGIIVFRRGI